MSFLFLFCTWVLYVYFCRWLCNIVGFIEILEDYIHVEKENCIEEFISFCLKYF